MAIVTPFVQVGTYPTRNFARWLLHLREAVGVAPALRVATQFGLYLHPRMRTFGVLVSEDTGASTSLSC